MTVFQLLGRICGRENMGLPARSCTARLFRRSNAAWGCYRTYGCTKVRDTFPAFHQPGSQSSSIGGEGASSPRRAQRALASRCGASLPAGPTTLHSERDFRMRSLAQRLP